MITYPVSLVTPTKLYLFISAQLTAIHQPTGGMGMNTKQDL